MKIICDNETFEFLPIVYNDAKKASFDMAFEIGLKLLHTIDFYTEDKKELGQVLHEISDKIYYLLTSNNTNKNKW